MPSSFSTDLKLELMVTGENAGTWGTKTNTNLNLLQQAIAGYQDISIGGGAQTTALTMDNAAISNARNAVIKLTGTITGNQIVTVPNGIEKTYIVSNGTTGAFTVQFKTASGTGTTFATTDKSTKILFVDGTNVVDTGTVSLTGFQTLTNKTLTSPTLTTPKIDQINDSNSNEEIKFTATASAVNELTIANAATGNSPTISATGGDTNIGLNLTPKGTGGIVLPAGAVGTPALTTSGDLNTGIFFPTADTIAFTEGGTEAMRITSNGRLGIGGTAPGVSLGVVGGIQARGGAPGALNVNNNGFSFAGGSGDNDGGMFSSADGQIEFYVNSGEMIRVDQNKVQIFGELRFNSGYGSTATAFGCRAWVNFNGTGTPAIRGSGNVTSITDNGVARYTVNFTTAMPDVNYAVSGSTNGDLDTFGGSGRQFYMVRVRATGSVEVNPVDDGGGESDSSFISTSIFR